jgi:hypothetical protein
MLGDWRICAPPRAATMQPHLAQCSHAITLGSTLPCNHAWLNAHMQPHLAQCVHAITLGSMLPCNHTWLKAPMQPHLAQCSHATTLGSMLPCKHTWLNSPMQLAAGARHGGHAPHREPNYAVPGDGRARALTRVSARQRLTLQQNVTRMTSLSTPHLHCSPHIDRRQSGGF